jgi:hypothetical protein
MRAQTVSIHHTPDDFSFLLQALSRKFSGITFNQVLKVLPDGTQQCKRRTMPRFKPFGFGYLPRSWQNKTEYDGKHSLSQPPTAPGAQQYKAAPSKRKECHHPGGPQDPKTGRAPLF